MRRRIEQGAEWQGHWSFIVPEKPPLPEFKNAALAVIPIDAFVLARLELEGLAPSEPADRERLLRRVTLDLTGLPPTIEEIDNFLNDQSREAYEKVVDRLLDSDRYGERMAYYKLDEGDGAVSADAVATDRTAKVQGQLLWAEGKFGKAFQGNGSNYVDLGDVGNFERNGGFSYGAWIKPTGTGNGAPIARMDDGGGYRGYDLHLSNGQVSVHIINSWPGNAIKVTTETKIKSDAWQHLFVTYDGSSKAAGVKIYFGGQPQKWKIEQDRLSDTIRDNALAASGLLVGTIGGPSVKPYQPAGLWNEISLSGERFVQDKGDKLYRRGMYTYWKRSSPAPSLTIFDTPTREKCVVRRSRTNTPLQALVTLNDPQYLEAARALAARAIHEGGATIESRITFAHRLSTGVRPREATLAVLKQAYEEELAVFAADSERANKLLAIGESPRDASIDPAEHAALMIVMSIILNLDETITRG